MKIIKAENQVFFDRLMQVRQQILSEYPMDETDYLENPQFEHFGFMVAGQIIAYAKIKLISSDTIGICFFGVNPLLHHQGFSEKFVRSIESWYQLGGVETVVCELPINNQRFYIHFGYAQYGASFYNSDGIEVARFKKVLIHNFSTQFTRVYDRIFPLNLSKQHLLKQFLQNSNSLLDVGCATGEVGAFFKDSLPFYLGIDVSQRMVETAYEKQVNVVNMDMRDIGVLDTTFSRILCMGNTLVFLDSLEEVNKQLAKFYNLLEHDGELFIQIINYEKVVKNQMHSLPTLKDKAMKCILNRNYDLIDNNQKVVFTIDLQVGRSHYQDKNTLLALRPSQLIQALEKNHFEIKNVFGSFKEDPFIAYQSESFLVWAKKKQKEEN